MYEKMKLISLCYYMLMLINIQSYLPMYCICQKYNHIFGDLDITTACMSYIFCFKNLNQG